MTLRRLLEARMGKQGKREFVQVLRLMEVFRADEVAAAVRNAIARGAIGFDAVKHLVLCHIERRPPRLDMTVYPYLPRAHVAMTSAKTYLGLGGQHHDRYAPTSARSSPEGTQAAHVPARARQARSAVRRRGPRSYPLSAAPGRTGADRPRTAHGGATVQRSAVPGREEPGQLRLRGHSLAQQDPRAGARPLGVCDPPGEHHRGWQQRTCFILLTSRCHWNIKAC